MAETTMRCIKHKNYNLYWIKEAQKWGESPIVLYSEDDKYDINLPPDGEWKKIIFE